jgi:hypothetical protein
MRHLIVACSLALATLGAHAEVIDIDNAELDKLIKRAFRSSTSGRSRNGKRPAS